MPDRVIVTAIALALCTAAAAIAPKAIVLNHPPNAECTVKSATWEYTHHTKTSIQIEGTIKGASACRKGTIEFVLYDQNDVLVKKGGALVDVGAFDHFFRHSKGVTRLKMDYEAEPCDW